VYVTKEVEAHIFVFRLSLCLVCLYEFLVRSAVRSGGGHCMQSRWQILVLCGWSGPYCQHVENQHSVCLSCFVCTQTFNCSSTQQIITVFLLLCWLMNWIQLFIHSSFI